MSSSKFSVLKECLSKLTLTVLFLNRRVSSLQSEIDFLTKRNDWLKFDLSDDVSSLEKRIKSLSKSLMWNSIALAIVSLGLLVHILLLHCL